MQYFIAYYLIIYYILLYILRYKIYIVSHNKENKMEILKIKLDGFKNIFETEIEFSNITALLSLNNYGKSNLIEGIKFALTYINVPNKIKTSYMKHIPLIPINKSTADKNFFFEIELKNIINNTEYFINYDFSFEWYKTDKSGNRIISENLKIKDKINDKFTTYIKRDSDNIGYYKTSETGRADKEIKTERDELIINKLIHFDLYYLDKIKDLNNLRFDPLTFYDPTDSFNFFPFEIENNEKFILDKNYGSNISRIIYELKADEDTKDKYELLINSFLSLFPNLKSVEPISKEFKPEKIVTNEKIPFKIMDKIYALYVQDDTINQPINFSSLSTGTKRIFLFLTEAILADKHKIPLISFEELENCVHPYLLQKILILLKEIAPECRLLITSHSPYLIKYLGFDNIYIGIPSEKGYAQFKKIKKIKQKSIMKSAEQQGESIGDFIFDKLVECYENPDLVEDLF